MATQHGPLQLWTPRHYSESAEIVVTIGTADSAQFAASGLDALFITCEPGWGSVAEVLGTAARNIALPSGRVIVVGDAAPWLAESQVDAVVAVSPSEPARYREWLAARKDRQLIFAASEELHALLPQATVIERMPALGQARGARVVYVRAAIDRGALPVLLQMAADESGTPVAQM